MAFLGKFVAFLITASGFPAKYEGLENFTDMATARTDAIFQGSRNVFRTETDFLRVMRQVLSAFRRLERSRDGV
jgi:hypothetical protein